MPNLPPHNLSHGPLGGDPVIPWDPVNGVYLYDDMVWGSAATDSRYSGSAGSGGGAVSPYANLGVSGTYDSYHRAQGVVEITSGVATSGAPNGAILCRGVMGVTGGIALNGYQLGYGPCTLKSRIALTAGNQQKGNSSLARFGFWQQTSGVSSVSIAASTAIGALILEYSPDNNSGNLRIGYTSGGAVGSAVSITYVNCSNAVPNFGQFEWWELDIDASLNVTALLGGVTIGTLSGLAPANLPMVPTWAMARGITFATQCLMTIDDLYLYYPYNRR